MIPTHELQSVSRWLEGCHRPLVVTHRRPDGDALGAVSALVQALRAVGKEPFAVLFEPLPERYALLRGDIPWLVWAEAEDVLAAECDAVIVVDTCALTQLEPILPFLRGGPPTLVIDHHATHDPLGTRDEDLRLFDETASATCLMVAEWIGSSGGGLTPEVALPLYVGIATDTGWFRFSNTDARTLRTVTGLVEAGVNPNEVYSEIYQQEPPAKLRLVARVVERMELLAGGRLAVMKLRLADFEATGADDTMTEDLVNEASRLKGVEATVLFTEQADGVRANFRSRRTLDVSELARRFGGGGHARAAGARLAGEWDRVVPRVINEMIEAL